MPTHYIMVPYVVYVLYLEAVHYDTSVVDLLWFCTYFVLKSYRFDMPMSCWPILYGKETMTYLALMNNLWVLLHSLKLVFVLYNLFQECVFRSWYIVDSNFSRLNNMIFDASISLRVPISVMLGKAFQNWNSLYYTPLPQVSQALHHKWQELFVEYS